MADPRHGFITEADGVITVTLDRPDKRNAITPQITALLWQATRALADRDDLRCMVITGRGPYFTAGMDFNFPVGDRPGNAETEDLHPGWNFRRNYRSHHLLYDEFEAIEKPIVLAAQGHCLGAGVEMAASCDFRFCAVGADFWLPEIAKLGIMAGSGGTSRLTRLIGPAWAKWMAMAGMRVGADQAQSIGLVQDVFPQEQFLDRVSAFCQHLVTLPAETLGVTKLAIDMYADVGDRTVQRNMDRLLVTGLLPSLSGWPAPRH